MCIRDSGYAYYAFDTPEELTEKRSVEPNFLYGQKSRMQMRNSLTLTPVSYTHLDVYKRQQQNLALL